MLIYEFFLFFDKFYLRKYKIHVIKYIFSHSPPLSLSCSPISLFQILHQLCKRSPQNLRSGSETNCKLSLNMLIQDSSGSLPITLNQKFSMHVQEKQESSTLKTPKTMKAQIPCSITKPINNWNIRKRANNAHNSTEDIPCYTQKYIGWPYSITSNLDNLVNPQRI